MISVTSQCTCLGSWWKTDPLRKNKPLFIGKCAQILRSTSPLSLRSMLDAPPASTLACAHQTGASALNLFDQWGEKEQAHLCYWLMPVSALAPVCGGREVCARTNSTQHISSVSTQRGAWCAPSVHTSVRARVQWFWHFFGNSTCFKWFWFGLKILRLVHKKAFFEMLNRFYLIWPFSVPKNWHRPL